MNTNQSMIRTPLVLTSCKSLCWAALSVIILTHCNKGSITTTGVGSKAKVSSARTKEETQSSIHLSKENPSGQSSDPTLAGLSVTVAASELAEHDLAITTKLLDQSETLKLLVTGDAPLASAATIKLPQSLLASVAGLSLAEMEISLTPTAADGTVTGVASVLSASAIKSSGDDLLVTLSAWGILTVGKKTATVPLAPELAAYSAVTQTTLTIQWSNVAAETGYKVERAAFSGSCGTFSQIGTTAADVVTYNDTGLTAATAYCYKVRAYNATGNGEYAAATQVTTLIDVPAAPTLAAYSAIGQTGLTVNWSNVAAETGYKIERAVYTSSCDTYTQIATAASDVVTYADTNLTAGTTYCYRVRATNAGGDSDYATATQVTTLVDPPSAPAMAAYSSIAQTTLSVNWSNVTTETGYKIERATYSGTCGTFSQIGTTAADVVTYADTGLTANTAYCYRVRATNAGGDGAYATASQVTTLVNVPSAPTMAAYSSIAQTTISVNWSNVASETGYKIERAPYSGSCGTYAQIGTTAADVVTYADTGLTANTSYCYRVRASNAGGDSSYATATQTTTLPNAPSAPTMAAYSSIAQTTLSVNWTDVTGETGYKIERAPYSGSCGTYAQIGTTAADVVTYADTGLTANTSYCYRVRATNTGGDSAYATESSVTTLVNVPSAPTMAAYSSIAQTTLSVNWSNVASETGYKVERAPYSGSCGTYAQIGTTAADVVTYADTGLTANTSYCYRVRASNAGGDSSYATATQTTTLPNAPSAPTMAAYSSIAQTTLSVNWTDVTGETGYKVERAPYSGSCGTYAQIGTTAADVVTYADTGLTANTSYCYRVRATNTGGDGAYATESSVTTLVNVPSAPTMAAYSSVAQTTLSVNWSNVASETGYKIERAPYSGSCGTYAQIGTTAADVVTYADTGLTANTSYCYRVRAYNSGGDGSYATGTNTTTLADSGSWSPITMTGTIAARSGHSVVWTGSKMIVWGGCDGSGWLNTGGTYDPISNSWTTTTTTNAPAGRESHSVIWTGSKMIVWGGADSGYFNTGGTYDPISDSWTTTTTTSAPAGRLGHSVIWTGSKMIVWGGSNSSYPYKVNDGGLYDPVANSWAAVTTTGAPEGRYLHAAFWTGSVMVVWGGTSASANVNTGGLYNPVANSWTNTTTTNAPAGRDHHSALWTGAKMIIWGGLGAGWLNSGSIYDPIGDSWTSMATTGAPSGRFGASVAWTGSNMIVWGGYGGIYKNDGGIYDPIANSWGPLATSSAPSARFTITPIWTGSKMLVWGGYPSTVYNDGGVYTPPASTSSNTWTDITTTGAPALRNSHTAVWTGSKMIIWGGLGSSVKLNDGGIYDPVANSWAATTTTNAPSIRNYHTAVWTGSKMIIWGGLGADYWNTGGIYDPVADTWTSPTTTNAPPGRYYHTAVWTGSKMIVWGGNHFGALNDGGTYDPIANSWTTTTMTNAPPTVQWHSAIWTGSTMIVWGGDHAFSPSNNGGVYDPVANAWTATSATNAPAARESHSAVWTGSKMIIWGYLGTGGMYDPITDSWTAITTTNAPAGSYGNSAVWTGSKMLVWGGTDGSANLNSGGLYDPITNTWAATTTTGAPGARGGQTATWTESKMLIWGGTSGSGGSAVNLNTGGIYTP